MIEIEFVEAFLRENSRYVRDKYADKNALTVTTKRHASDLLTEVDLTIQKRFVDRVEAEFPGDAIVGEEGEYTHLPKDRDARAWVIDPIDGTYNFVRGFFPVFGISIAFVMAGKAMAGGVLLPELEDLFLAERGNGSYRNGKRLQVSSVQQAAEACIDIDFCGPEDRAELFRRGAQILLKAGQMRCRGSAVVSICQIATGDIDAYLHMVLHPWDYAASQLIVEEAGGMATRLDGAPLRVFDGKRGVLVSNGAIHNELMGMLRP